MDRFSHLTGDWEHVLGDVGARSEAVVQEIARRRSLICGEVAPMFDESPGQLARLRAFLAQFEGARAQGFERFLLEHEEGRQFAETSAFGWDKPAGLQAAAVTVWTDALEGLRKTAKTRAGTALAAQNPLRAAAKPERVSDAVFGGAEIGGKLFGLDFDALAESVLNSMRVLLRAHLALPVEVRRLKEFWIDKPVVPMVLNGFTLLVAWLRRLLGRREPGPRFAQGAAVLDCVPRAARLHDSMWDTGQARAEEAEQLRADVEEWAGEHRRANETRDEQQSRAAKVTAPPKRSVSPSAVAELVRTAGDLRDRLKRGLAAAEELRPILNDLIAE